MGKRRGREGMSDVLKGECYSEYRGREGKGEVGEEKGKVRDMKGRDGCTGNNGRKGKER